jgi:hypothetical protein
MTVVPPRINYEQRVVAVLKAVAVGQATITLSNLAWAVDYQRMTRSLDDLLAYLRPLFEDHGWPPLTSLAVNDTTKRPDDEVFGLDWRMAQRQCWAWAQMTSTQRRRLDPAVGEEES